MANIIVPQRRVWTRQPQRPVGVDWSNPLTRGLTLCLSGADPLFDHVRQRSLTATVTGSVLTGVIPQGRVLTTPDGGWIAVDVNQDWSGQNTVVFAAKINSIDSNWGGLFYKSGSSASVVQFALGRYSNGNTFYGSSNGTSYNIGTSSVSSVLGKYAVFVMTQTGVINDPFYLWINGVFVGSVVSQTGAQPTGSGPLYLGCSPDRSASYDSAIDIVGFQRYNRIFSAAEIVAVSANHWQIFARRPRRTIIDFGASGTTPVYADSALTYYIRSMLSSDSGVQYAIRNAIYKDDAVGYYLRAAIAQNSEVGYILRSAIAQDDAEAYKIRGLIQADDAEAYNVRGLVQTTDSETYSIRGLVQSDATSNYDIQSSTSVASTSTASYSVRGSVASDGSPQYSVRGAAQSDSSAGYSVRASAYRDVVSSYAIDAAESVVYADLTTSYSIDGVAPACPTADQIAAAVLSALNATTIPVNVTHFNGNPTVGSGTPADPVRPA